MPSRRLITRTFSGPILGSGGASFPDIIFYWGMEQGTFSNADKATGSAIGVVNGSAAVSTSTVRVGTHSLSGPTVGAYVAFNPTGNFDFTQGGIGLWYYQSTAFANFGDLFRIQYSGSPSNNVVYCSTTSAGHINWQWIAGGTGTSFRTTTGTVMTTNNWYWVQLLRNGNVFTLSIYDTAGSIVDTDTQTVSLGVLDGALDQMLIGDSDSNSNNNFYDNVLVTNSTSRNLQTINTGTSF